MPIEQQLLPGASLKPAYDKVAWLYVNRNFDNSPLDRTAERIELRFGITSYPHLLLVDPVKLEVVAEMGRTDKAFLSAVERARVEKPDDPKAAPEKLRLAGERLAKFEKAPTAAAARKLLADEDVVVRYRAVQTLARLDPKSIAAKAEELLGVAHDPIRYEVCGALAKLGDKSSVATLEALAEDPKGSQNPNVLRTRAVEALARCGGESSVAVIAKFAKGDVNNGLTEEAIDALAAIAARVPKAKPAVKDALVESYPPPGGKGSGEAKRALELAQKVHLALGRLTNKRVQFPATYDEASRAKLMKSW